MKGEPMERKIVIIESNGSRANEAKRLFLHDCDEKIRWIPRAISGFPALATASELVELIDHHAQAEWVRFFLLAVDVHFPAGDFAGLDIVYRRVHGIYKTRALRNPSDNENLRRLPWDHVFLCTVHAKEFADPNSAGTDDYSQTVRRATPFGILEDHILPPPYSGTRLYEDLVVAKARRLALDVNAWPCKCTTL